MENSVVVRLSQAATVAFVRVGADAAVLEHGQAQPALLPRGPRLVAVWPAERHALLALQLPAMPAARLRAALAGALEDRLLDDAATVHLAAAPRTADGAVQLACSSSLDALRDALRQLTEAARTPDAVVPESALLEPGEAWLLPLDTQRVRLLWRSADGEAGWLHADAQGPAPALRAQRLVCAPELRALAERWWQLPADEGDDDALLARAARSGWDLRQFELAPQAAMQRGLLSVRAALRTPPWRRVLRLALVLALVQVVGIEAVALQLRARRLLVEHDLSEAASLALPGSPAILDASLQLQRALDLARRRAGEPDSGSLETLLGAAAQVLPSGTPIDAIDYQPGQLHLAVGAAVARAAAERCTSLGLRCSAQDVTLRVHARVSREAP